MEPTKTRYEELEELVGAMRNSYPDGQTFVMAPFLLQELRAYGLDTFGLEFCHELAGDGVHEHARGISGTHLRFKGVLDGVHEENAAARVESRKETELSAEEKAATDFPRERYAPLRNQN